MRVRPGVRALVAVVAAGGVAVAVLVADESVRFTAIPGTQRVVVGTVSDFPIGSAVGVELALPFDDPDPRFGARSSVRVFVAHDPVAGLLALYRRDSHLGCLVGSVADLPEPPGLVEFPGRLEIAFWNPCHGESYALDGCKLGGPSPRGLDRFAVDVSDDGRVIVDVARFEFGPPIGSC